MDRVFEVLAGGHRRQVLIALLNHEGPVDLNLEAEETLVDQQSWTRKRTALYHRHLPMLEKADLIQWDKEEQTITKGDRFEEIRPYVELIDKKEDHPQSGP